MLVEFEKTRLVWWEKLTKTESLPNVSLARTIYVEGRLTSLV